MALTVRVRKLVDHSLLKPQLTEEEIIKGCELAKEAGCISVCVQPVSIKLASEVAAAILWWGLWSAFPLAPTLPRPRSSKLSRPMPWAPKNWIWFEYWSVKVKQYNLVKDIKAVVDATPAIVKVILETCYHR